MRCPPVSPMLFEARFRSEREVLEGRKVDSIMAPFSPILFQDRSSTSTWQFTEVRKLQISEKMRNEHWKLTFNPLMGSVVNDQGVSTIKNK